MTQEDQAQEYVLTITVKTTDGAERKHTYVYLYPLNEDDFSNVRHVGQIAGKAMRTRNATVTFLNPRALYRTNYIMSITAEDSIIRKNPDLSEYLVSEEFRRIVEDLPDEEADA